MITEKENLLMAMRGECPERIPTYSIVAKQLPGQPPPSCVVVTPEFLATYRQYGVGGTDVFGVEYLPTHEANGAVMPKTWDFLLKDIRNWRDIIKAPDISGFDWEQIAKKSIEKSNINRANTALAFDLHFGYFQNLMAFMGFSEGLCALYEEPEECRALFDYLCGFYCEVAGRIIEYYDPDILVIKDDTATAASPFISPDIYEDLLLPLYDRQIKFGRDRGIPIAFHNCGKCEMFVESMVSIGVNMWDPAQPCNDLDGIKAKYANKLVIAGGWQARGRLLDKDVSDDELRESVRAVVERLAKGGGYAFMGGFLGPAGDEETLRKNSVIWEMFNDIRYSFYKS